MRVVPLILLGLLPWNLTAAQPGPLGDLVAVQVPPAPAAEGDAAEDDALADTPGGQFWFGKRVVVDTWGIVSSPFDWSGKEWAIAAGAVGATVATGLFVDKRFQDESQESHNPQKDKLSTYWGDLGT